MRRMLLVAVGLLASCYDASFDGSADQVFACADDDECPSTHRCFAMRCRLDVGPQVTIAGPEEGTPYDVAPEVRVGVSIRGADLQLDEPGGSHREGVGYLQLEVDGVPAPDLVIAGDLSAGVSAEVVLTDPRPGLHRIRARAFQVDGKAYGNPSAFGDTVIWVSDGLPHVGLRHPWPGDEYVAGEALFVEVMCRGCEFTDPTLDARPVVVDPLPIGHSHIYFERREGVPGTLDYPACLPDCNFDYPEGGSIKPSGVQGQARVSGDVQQVPTEAGTMRITASLNFTGHTPYPAETLDPAVWSATPELYDQLVNDTIEIRLVGPDTP